MYFQSIENNSASSTDRLNNFADSTGLNSILVMQSLPTIMKVILANHQPVYSANDEGPKSVQEGCHELYCERVIDTKKELLVSNASVDPEWVNNEDLVKFGLGTYLGLPLIVNDKAVGTVCVLNNKEFDFHAGSPSAYDQLIEFKAELEQEIIASL
jgi:GAF domain-containing protein